jgi:hypothetical protein
MQPLLGSRRLPLLPEQLRWFQKPGHRMPGNAWLKPVDLRRWQYYYS